MTFESQVNCWRSPLSHQEEGLLPYLGDIPPLGQLPVGWDWRLRGEHGEAVAGFVRQPRAVLPPGCPISLENLFQVQKSLRTGWLMVLLSLVKLFLKKNTIPPWKDKMEVIRKKL